MSLTEILSRANPPEDARATVELEKMRFELSWRYFDFHARQRTQLFHFFIILTPFMLGGCFYLFKERTTLGHLPSVVAPVVGAILALVFFGLDRRNKQLINVGERAIRLFEKHLLFTSNFRPLTDFQGLITTEDHETDGRRLSRLRSHTFLMGAVYWLVFLIFLAFATYVILLQRGYLDSRFPAVPMAQACGGSTAHTDSAAVTLK